VRSGDGGGGAAHCTEADRTLDENLAILGDGDAVESHGRADASPDRLAGALERDHRTAFGQAIALANRQTKRSGAFEKANRDPRTPHRDQGQARQPGAGDFQRRYQRGEIFGDENERLDPAAHDLVDEPGQIGSERVGQADIGLRQRHIAASRQDGGVEAGDGFQLDARLKHGQMPAAILSSHCADHGSSHRREMVDRKAYPLGLRGRP
jgi:hypothetical protein